MTFNIFIRRTVQVDSDLQVGEIEDRTDRSVRVPASEFFEFYTADSFERLEWFKKWFDIKMAYAPNALVKCRKMELDHKSWIIEIGTESETSE